MLLYLSFVFMLQSFHFFFEQGVLGVELLVCSVDLQGLLDFFLHVVAILLEFTYDLLLRICPFLCLLLALFELILQVLDLRIVALLKLLQVSRRI